MAVKGDPRVLRFVYNPQITSWTNVGGANFGASVSDDVNTSYARGPGRDQPNFGHHLRLSANNPSIAANERTVAYRARIKAGVLDAGGSTRRTGMYFQIRRSFNYHGLDATHINYIPTFVSTPREYVGKWFSRDPDGRTLWSVSSDGTPAMDEAMVFLIDNTPQSFTAGQQIRVYEVYLDYIVNRQPTLTSLAASEVTTTTRPLITYDWNDADGDVQRIQRIKIFTNAQTTLPGFDPETAQPVYYANTVTSLTEHRVAQSLQDGVQYRVYAKAAHDLGDLGYWYSDWVSTTFTITLTGPMPPVLTLGTYDIPEDRALLSLQGRINMLNADDASAEVLVGWVAGTNANTPVRDTAQAIHGAASVRGNSTAAGLFNIMTNAAGSGYEAIAGKTYGIGGRGRAVTTSRNVTWRLEFMNAAFSVIGSFATTPIADASGAWTAMQTATGTAPANTKFMRLVAEWNNSALGEGHYTDAHIVVPGAIPTNFHAGSLLGTTTYRIEYADMPRRGNLVPANIASCGEADNTVDGFFPRQAGDGIEVTQEVQPYRGRRCLRWNISNTGSVLDIGSRQSALDSWLWAAVPGRTYEGAVRVRVYTGSALISATFRFLDGTGAVLGSMASGNISATTAWTNIECPDTAAPAGTVVVRLELQNQSGAIDFPFFVDNIQFGEFPYLLTQNGPGQGEPIAFRPWRESVDLETGSTDAIVLYDDSVAEQEAAFFDHEVPPDKVRIYRAQAISVQGGVDTGSAWTPWVSQWVDITRAWLKHPFQAKLNWQPVIKGMRPHNPVRGVRRGIHTIVGRRTPVVLTSSNSSDNWSLTIYAQTDRDWERLEEMIEGDGPLLLKTPNRQWYFQIAADIEIKHWLENSGEGEIHVVQLGVTEVATP